MGREKFEKVVQVVKETMEEHHVPGIAVGIIVGDQMYTTGLGVTSVDNPLDVTDETLFQIGSITKTYTATAIMRLVEQGKLDLNARVRQYLPDFKVLDDSVANKVTVKHLVTHSAGWVGDVFTDTGSNDDSMKLYVEQMAELEQLAPPDTVFSYNNAAFAVAGHLIETVTGKTYEAAIQELIFDPLGLERSFFFPKDLLTYRFVVGHVVIEDAAIVQRPWAIPRSSNAAGGITCHVKDLLNYARFHMGDGTTADGAHLLSSGTLELMQTGQFPINDFDGDIGLSWWIKERNGVKLVGHGGTTIGQTCDMVFAPSKQFAVAILANGNHGSLPVHAGFKVALKEYLGIEEPESESAPASAEELQGYVGKYERPAATFEVTQDEGYLFAKMIPNITLGDEKPPEIPPFKLSMSSKDQFFVTEGMYKDLRVEFLRKAGGNIGWLRLGARINRRVES